MTVRFLRSLRTRLWLSFAALLLCFLPASGALAEAVPSNWTTPVPPFRIADNLYYVGSRDLAAYLITTPSGNILLNSNYITSPPQIRQSVEQLGFRWRDIRILLLSHAHVDHAGGTAAILRETGAQLEVMQGDVDVMETGGRTDFAFGGPGKPLQFPPAHVNRTLHDGDTVSLGGVTLTAHLTAGHTRGCTTWTLRVHLPGDPPAQLRNAVILGSASVLSEYRLVPLHGRPASYPGIADDYRRTFATLHSLPCEVFLAAHGSMFHMLEKLPRMASGGDRVWIDPTGYQRFIQAQQDAFEADLAKQQAAARTGAAHAR